MCSIRQWSTKKGSRRYLRGPSPLQPSHEGRTWSKEKVAGLILAFGLLASAGWTNTPAVDWPSFLPSRASLSSDLAAAVERTWTDRTLSRTVRGPSVRAPFDLYSALIDAPEVTAAAARYRNYSKDEVHQVGDDLYEADDHDGSRGFYRLLVRDRDRRVIFSWGEHSGSILGTIRGDALTVLTLEPGRGVVHQTLTAYVRIDNAFLAALARTLLVPFGGLADRKLSEGFRVSKRVAEWAVSEPAEFCSWLGQSGIPFERRALVQSLVPGCQETPQARAPASAR
jgi:hypothetical protein